jgi:hypothetical protein
VPDDGETVTHRECRGGPGRNRGRARATGLYLAQLLEDSSDYRARWRARARRHSGHTVHQGAVARVIAEYLWETGEYPESDLTLPRRLKDVVSRALRGEVLAPTTLRWFVEAFRLSPPDAACLWALEYGEIEDGDSGCPEQAHMPPGHRTLALHEFHTLGADGHPADHRTVHLIRALEPISRVRYRPDGEVAAVEVLRGGVVGCPGTRPGSCGHGEFDAVDIELHRCLAPGETASLEYRTRYLTGGRPATSFRRSVRYGAGNVEIHVQFHRRFLPRRIWWAAWEEPSPGTGEPTLLEEVCLEPDGSVHRYLEWCEGGSLGFSWSPSTRSR